MKRDKILAVSNTTVAIILVVALAAMANWLGYRHWVRGDWTGSKIYSLSDKTKNVLTSVKGEVRAVVFMTPATPLFAETRELLNRYTSANSHIKVEFIDPERDPLRTQTLAKEFGVSAANTVVFIAGERKKYVTSEQLADYDYSGMQMGAPPKLKGFKGEEQFTAAILGVVNPKTPKIYFTTGHGEIDPDGMGEESCTQLRELLKRDNLEVAKISLLSGSTPTDADLLVIAGPAAAWAESEKSALKAYLDAGGRALILLDPLLGGQQRASGLEEFLKGYGVLVSTDVVVDPTKALPGFSMAAVYADEFRSHPVVNGLRGLAVLLPVARSVTTVQAAGASSTILLATSDKGWGETDIAGILARKPMSKDANDTPGPVSLGVAAQSETAKDTGWRLVVFGNSQFITNAYLANLGNPSLAMNAVNWLAKREQSLGIPPRAPEQVSLFMTQEQMRTVFLVSLLGMPLAAIALGVAVWWRRRH